MVALAKKNGIAVGFLLGGHREKDWKRGSWILGHIKTNSWYVVLQWDCTLWTGCSEFLGNVIYIYVYMYVYIYIICIYIYMYVYIKYVYIYIIMYIYICIYVYIIYIYMYCHIIMCLFPFSPVPIFQASRRRPAPHWKLLHAQRRQQRCPLRRTSDLAHLGLVAEL